jgi:hypothetical protein
MRYFVFSLLMFAAGVALTQVDREPHAFTPVVRVRTTDGLFITFVQRGVFKRSSCSQSVEIFARVVKESCWPCMIESAACSSQLEGMDRALANDEHLPLFTVSADDFRIAIVGPPNSVQAECGEMAAQMIKQGIKNADCHNPVLGAATNQ